MRIVSRVGGATAIIFILTGCAVPTHSDVAIPNIPPCDATFARLAHSGVENKSGGRIPESTPEPIRLCRYRWANAENRLTLTADITLPLVPVTLVHSLSQLKTVYEIYGPNAVFACTPGKGNVDVVILRAAAGSELTIVEVQRDGCREAIVTHSGFVTYIAYMPTASLLVQLDAVKAVT